MDVSQIIYNWFDETKDPVAKWGKPYLILIGGHARLSNIDDDHRFIEDEMFVYAGEEIHHEAGAKTGLMYNFVELRKEARKEKDERTLGYFNEFMDVYAQPAGFEDSVISAMKIRSLRAQPSPPEPSPAQDSSSSDLENDDAVDDWRVTVEVEDQAAWWVKDATVFTR